MIELYTNKLVRNQSEGIKDSLTAIVNAIGKDVIATDEIQDAMKSPLVEIAHNVTLSIPNAKSIRNDLHRLEIAAVDKIGLPRVLKPLLVKSELTGAEYSIDTTHSFRGTITIVDEGSSKFVTKILGLNQQFAVAKEKIHDISRCKYTIKNTKAFFLEFPTHEDAFYEMFSNRWTAAEEKAKEYSVTRKERIEQNKKYKAQRLAEQQKEEYDVANNLVDKNEKAKDIANAISKATLINSALYK